MVNLNPVPRSLESEFSISRNGGSRYRGVLHHITHEDSKRIAILDVTTMRMINREFGVLCFRIALSYDRPH